MEKNILRAVVAMAANRVIGRDGRLPWHLPGDLKWFKKLTLGHPIVMGRKTMESIGGKPLPGRRNLVLSRSWPADAPLPEGFERLASDDPDEMRKLDPVVSVIGGAEIFRLLLPYCDEVFLTSVFADYEGDTVMPPFEHHFELAEVMDRQPEFEVRRYVRLKTGT